MPAMMRISGGKTMIVLSGRRLRHPKRIAKAIADQLQAKLSPNEKNAIEQPPTTDLAAFELYSRAKSILITAAFSADLRRRPALGRRSSE